MLTASCKNIHRLLGRPFVGAFSRARACSSSMAEEAPVGKRPKPPLSIGTHNGTFHCDEALGCFLLRLTPRFRDAHIVRTRDPQVLGTLDAVLDVGGIYEHESYRYDHHQKGFEVSFGHGFNTKLSSAGLVYKHFGLDIVSKEMDVESNHPDVIQMYKALYKNFVEAIDAVDNGVNQYDTDKLPRYVDNTRLSGRVAKLNPDWIEVNSTERENDCFNQAMELAGQEFLDSLRYHVKSWLPARSIVSNCIKKRKELEQSGQIMMLDRFCPWKEHIHELEEELQVDPSIKYVLYQDGRNLQWRIQAVVVAVGKFESRRPLPAAWRGLVDEKLSEVVGVGGCVFVHSSGFIGGNISFEGVLAMGKKALVLN
ncbi:hypothetical protein GOP47_0006289 [Adiantum capillus-veneris]|uniref:Metal-dependent protein hydrolase n=1 Tax=Adiantum capillus-veneris TaxID=13818 RepID=A0A9D4V3K0_ADICA|nr:hypothetical protein GOP47_0006289 [Adiantum capillus-veneris]